MEDQWDTKDKKTKKFGLWRMDSWHKKCSCRKFLHEFFGLCVFYIGKPFITTDASEIQKILERSKNLSRKCGRNRSTSPDASVMALKKKKRL